MWLFNSSIGKKFIMALTGICLVLFVTFHVLMNAVAIIWPGAYNVVCQFLGANWYALIASMGLGLLFVIHIIDALVLTVQNRKARGNDRYAVNARPKTVEWSSQNMLVLGIVVLLFLGLHLVQFWARMQYQELIGSTYVANGVEVPPAAGTLFLQLAFQSWWTPVLYIIGFIALWFHMNHGFWSMWQSVGWDNATWLPRLKCISAWWVSIVCGLFALQAVVFGVRAHTDYYVNDPALRSQYIEMYQEHFEHANAPLMDELTSLQIELQGLQSGETKVADPIVRQSEIYARAQEIQGELQANQAKMMECIMGIDKIAKCPACAEEKAVEQLTEPAPEATPEPAAEELSEEVETEGVALD